MMSLQALKDLQLEGPPEWAHLTPTDALSAERYLDFVVAWLAPVQCLPLTPEHLPPEWQASSWLSGLTDDVWARCEALAERGERAAIDLLSGQGWHPSAERGLSGSGDGWGRLWHAIPIEMRRRWVTAGKSAPGFVERWLMLIDDQTETLMVMAQGLDDGEAHALMHRALSPGYGPLGDDLWSVWNNPWLWHASGPPGATLAPSLDAIIALAQRRRDVAILAEICALPDRWLTAARLKHIARGWAIDFDVRPVEWPLARRDPTPLDAAFAPRGREDGDLWRGYELLVELAHHAAEVLLKLGRPQAMTQAWSRTCDDWPLALRDRLADGELWAKLAWVDDRVLAPQLDTMPRGVEAFVETLWAAVDPRAMHLVSWRSMSEEPSYCGYSIAQQFGVVAAAREWLGLEQNHWPLPHATLARLRRTREEPSEDDLRWLHAALVVRLVQVHGSDGGWASLWSTFDDPPDAIERWQTWLEALIAATTARPYPIDQNQEPRRRLTDLTYQQRIRAGRALLDVGDMQPLLALMDGQLPPGIANRIWSAMSGDSARVRQVWQRVDEPVEWRNGTLFAAALEFDLPPAIAALAELPRQRRRVEVHRHLRRPWAVPLIEALADEAWAAGEHRESAAWAVMLHLEHRPWNAPLERAVRHWMFEDLHPFDRGQFSDDGHRFVGGANPLAGLTDMWRKDGKRPIWWASGVRCLFERVGVSPQLAVSYFNPRDWKATSILPGRELQVDWQLARPNELIWRWLREIDAVDVRDACLDAAEAEGAHLPSAALDWWVETADRDALWAALGCVVRSPGFHQRPRANAAVSQLVDQADPDLADWFVELCSDPLLWDGDPFPRWLGTHGHMSPDGRCMYLLRLAPDRIIDVHRRWITAAATIDQRVSVMRHLALMVDLLAEHGIDASAEVRRLTDCHADADG